MSLVLIAFTTDNVVCFPSVSISVFHCLLSYLLLLLFFVSFNCECNEQILVTA